jgi:hypothetical protein
MAAPFVVPVPTSPLQTLVPHSYPSTSSATGFAAPSSWATSLSAGANGNSGNRILSHHFPSSHASSSLYHVNSMSTLISNPSGMALQSSFSFRPSQTIADLHSSPQIPMPRLISPPHETVASLFVHKNGETRDQGGSIEIASDSRVSSLGPPPLSTVILTSHATAVVTNIPPLLPATSIAPVITGVLTTSAAPATAVAIASAAASSPASSSMAIVTAASHSSVSSSLAQVAVAREGTSLSSPFTAPGEDTLAPLLSENAGAVAAATSSAVLPISSTATATGATIPDVIDKSKIVYAGHKRRLPDTPISHHGDQGHILNKLLHTTPARLFFFVPILFFFGFVFHTCVWPDNFDGGGFGGLCVVVLVVVMVGVSVVA